MGSLSQSGHIMYGNHSYILKIWLALLYIIIPYNSTLPHADTFFFTFGSVRHTACIIWHRVSPSTSSRYKLDIEVIQIRIKMGNLVMYELCQNGQCFSKHVMYGAPQILMRSCMKATHDGTELKRWLYNNNEWHQAWNMIMYEMHQNGQHILKWWAHYV